MLPHEWPISAQLLWFWESTAVFVKETVLASPSEKQALKALNHALEFYYYYFLDRIKGKTTLKNYCTHKYPWSSIGCELPMYQLLHSDWPCACIYPVIKWSLNNFSFANYCWAILTKRLCSQLSKESNNNKKIQGRSYRYEEGLVTTLWHTLEMLPRLLLVTVILGIYLLEIGISFLSDTEWYELKCLTLSPTACINSSSLNSLPSSFIKGAIILNKFPVLSIPILLTLRNFQQEKKKNLKNTKMNIKIQLQICTGKKKTHKKASLKNVQYLLNISAV